jgi:hypothetical protein
MSIAFQVLLGVPPYGPLPQQFGATGEGRYLAGFVVEFRDENGAWVGNFMGGATGFNTVFECPYGRSVAVIAAGQGYMVDPRVQKVTSMFGGTITGVAHTGADRVVFSTFADFEAYGARGRIWQQSTFVLGWIPIA